MNKTAAMYSRRDFLKFAGAGAATIALSQIPGVARAVADDRKFVVMINLDGGNDSLNTVVPLNLGSYHDRRPGLGIDAPLDLTSGSAASNDYGLHPGLPALQTLHAEGAVAIVQKTGYPNANRSHFTSKDVFHTGDSSALNADRKSGWIARYAKLYNDHTLGCISIGHNAKALQGDGVNLLQASNLENFTYQNDGRYPGESQRRQELARQMLARYQSGATNPLAIRNAIQLGHDNVDLIRGAIDNYVPNVDYADVSFSRSLQGIAQLIQAGGLGTDIYYTGMGGFDTHGGQGSTSGRHPSLMFELNRGIESFANDMKLQGKWNDCVIVVFSEFGRRNFENGSGGTDHGDGQTMMVLGGAVNGGSYGSMLTDADIRDHDSMPMEVDFRSVFGEVIDKHLGHASDAIFTDTNRLSLGALGIL
jgi:uncharacterized protein (DUF1501 family)